MAREAAAAPRAVLERELSAGLAALALPAPLAGPLLAYLDELQKWNAAYNLTAVREPLAMVRRHLLDSLAVLPYVRSPLLDVGSGAGLPGIPLALARPALAVTLLDSNGKKARFLRHAVRSLGLDKVQVVQERAEAYLPAAGFASVVSRAFGTVAEFVRVTAHLLAADGQWLAMKGKLDRREMQDLPAGVGVVEVKPLNVPGLGEQRHLVILARRPG
ncbi:MAG: 16S rRNA (guanine(527)-N(7))-methyltransferase RsmG [Nevskia sp.]|nr:16S rRNA (guanine(527)-N(7))-methyltransferase RsmG [Nevskia sp.]